LEDGHSKRRGSGEATGEAEAKCKESKSASADIMSCMLMSDVEDVYRRRENGYANIEDQKVKRKNELQERVFSCMYTTTNLKCLYLQQQYQLGMNQLLKKENRTTI